jgi:hypothetical protein
MSSRVCQQLIEVFLLVEQPRQRLSHWSQTLAPLDGPDAPPIASVDAYYDPTSNQAIVGLRYDELVLGPDRVGFLVEMALLAEIGMIQPAELSEADRERFVHRRLSNCTLHVGDQRKIVRALVELVRRAREQKQVATLPRLRRDIPRPSPNVISRAGVHRANTVVMSTAQNQQMIEAASAGPAIEVPTEPYLPAAGDSLEPDTIYGRYQRSGRWVPLRIGALSLKGAVLMAGALPRHDDRIEIALAYTNYRALVRGVVEKISTRQEAASSGTTTFNVRFELDAVSRQEFAALLTAARAAKVTLRPSPLRSTRRYPIEWPICLGTGHGAMRAEALDVSTNGMFVKPPHALALEAKLTFSAVLDDGSSSVSGRSRVIRNMSDAAAKAVGRPPGYGLSIIEMLDEDRNQWLAFLMRIEQRAGKRVLIGAAPARLDELQKGLGAAGYVVTGGSEPSVIARLASETAHPVDAALIDASWLAQASSSRVESLFSVRKVPCVTVHGDVQRARVAVDRLLSVV